jgi:4-hydroxy-tetrahydrodipicolinate synthase
VIAGTGSNSTQEAIDLSQHAERAGADACLLVSPYYNRPTQKGLYLHFKAVAESIRIPIILYNIASRTGVNIEPETMQQLARDCKNIVGVKEASGSLDQMSRIHELCGSDFQLISGDDSLTLPLLSIGGIGIISVAANIIPRDVADMVSLFDRGDIAKAQALHYKMLPLIKALFIETNPIPLKTALGMLGLCKADVRLPLCSMKADNEEKLRTALKNYGLLK